MPSLGDVLAANVRGERSRLRWRQQDLADRLGWTNDAVSRMESGKRRVTMDDLPSLCRVLNLSVAELLRGADPEDLAPLRL